MDDFFLGHAESIERSLNYRQALQTASRVQTHIVPNRSACCALKSGQMPVPADLSVADTSDCSTPAVRKPLLSNNASVESRLPRPHLVASLG